MSRLIVYIKYTFALIFIFFEVSGQVELIEFPKTMQLIGREENNFGIVKVKGTALNSENNIIFLKVYANSILVKLEKDTIKDVNYNFEYSVPIKASLNEFSFKLELLNISTGEIAIIKEADEIVCGDAIILYGQSNMVALNGYEEFKNTQSNKFIRSFYTNAFGEMVWGKNNLPYEDIGTLGSNLAKNIVDNHRIPICIINGALGGANIDLLKTVNPDNHYDPSFPFGLLLSRIRESGLQDKVKSFAYYQGETDAGSWYLSCNEYPQDFDDLYNLIHEDLKSLKKLYVFQINILNGNYVERAGFLRDFQRSTKNKYPDVEVISTVGMKPFDGIHFGSEAYKEKGNKLFKVISRDFYASENLEDVNSPNIQYAYYSPNKDSLYLIFDKNQNLEYPADSNISNYTRKLRDFISLTSDSTNIYFNHFNKPIISGTADKNIITLLLREPSNYKFINYLPSTFSDDFSNFYNGVHIKNQKGNNALSFYLFPINLQPPPQENIPNNPKYLNASSISSSEIRLNWLNESEIANISEIEISIDSVNFSKIFAVSSNFQRISKLNSNQKYFFRVRSCIGNSCSEYSNISFATTHFNDTNSCLDLVIDYSMFNLTKTYLGNKIESKAHIANNSKVNYFGVFSILLNPGFKVEGGAVFKAAIDSCY